MPKHTTSYDVKHPRAHRRGRQRVTGSQLPRGRARSVRRKGASYIKRTRGFGRGRGRQPKRNNERKPFAIMAVGCAFLLFVTSIIWYVNRGVEITVNGETVSVRINSTIEQYIEDNDLESAYDAGDLLAVDDSVLERGGGDPYSVTLDGETVDVDDLSAVQLTGGEELTIDDGADVYEEHDVEATVIEPTLTVSGSGAICYVQTWGIAGRSEVWTGHTSGLTVDRGVVLEVQDCVIRQRSVSPDDDRQVIALTFDEGPSSYTEQIVSILQEKGVAATFFLQGEAIEGNEDAVQAIADAGFEIGSNSYSETSLSALSADDLRTELSNGFSAIEEVTGESVSLLRAPYGTFSEQNWCDAMDLVSAVVTWNIDSGDWLLPGADTVVETVVGSVTTGNIVLLTDNETTGAQLVEALPTLIDELLEAGYELLTLSDLIATDEDLAAELDLSQVSMPTDAVLPTLSDDEE